MSVSAGAEAGPDQTGPPRRPSIVCSSSLRQPPPLKKTEENQNFSFCFFFCLFACLFYVAMETVNVGTQRAEELTVN